MSLLSDKDRASLETIQPDQLAPVKNKEHKNGTSPLATLYTLSLARSLALSLSLLRARALTHSLTHSPGLSLSLSLSLSLAPSRGLTLQMVRMLLLPWVLRYRYQERSQIFPRQSVARVVVEEEACVTQRPFAAKGRFH